MVDNSNSAEESEVFEEFDPVSQFIADVAGESVVPGIPAPVRRNIFKAFGQLCSAAIDLPVASLSGLANERRAESEARVRLINTTAEQIAKLLETDPEYSRIAFQKYGARILREQVNLDLTCKESAIDILDTSHSIDQSVQEESGNSISDDWLNAFEAEARQKSTSEMQAYFGRVLSGEIKKPGSFSTRTVRILASLDQVTASHFARLCSMCISTSPEDVRVVSLEGNAANNSLREYGLSFATLNLLNEYDLVISDYNSWMDFLPFMEAKVNGAEMKGYCMPLTFQGRHFTLEPTDRTVVNKVIKMHGVALTKSGRELSKIVNVEPVGKYLQDLALFFQHRGLRMVEGGDGKPRIVDLRASAEY